MPDLVLDDKEKVRVSSGCVLPTKHMDSAFSAPCRTRAQRRVLMCVGANAGLPVPIDFLEDSPDPLFVGCHVEVKIDATGDWIRARSVVSVLF